MTTGKELMYQALAIGLVGISIFSHESLYKTTYQKAYTEGYNKAQTEWRETLIDADYAEYDRKNGNWKLRSMEDVLMAGTILGRAKPDGWFPEPEVDSKEVKETLKQKLKGKAKKS